MKIVVAGASGFVGRALLAELSEQHEVTALTRSSSIRYGDHEMWAAQVRWRQTDLFSLGDSEDALAGHDVGIYLVHSMSPTARLSQGKFEDFDLVLADNFARAAATAQLKRIVYLGGLMPHHSKKISMHLLSRLEVEQVLTSYGAPLTAIRAGLVVGPQGSSFEMMTRLARRLPIMVCPSWTMSQTQPIALSDMVSLLRAAVEHPDALGPVSVGCPDVITYRDMMLTAAKMQGKHPRTLSIPLFSPGLSVLWVTMVTQSPRALVAPLVQSLKHNMVVADDTALKQLGGAPTRFVAALQAALAWQPKPRSRTLRSTPNPNGLAYRETVRSIQRLQIPEGKNALWVAEQYVAWAPRFLKPWVRVVCKGAMVYFRFLGFRQNLLELEYHANRSGADRQLFWIRGGLLAHVEAGSKGRLEFRQMLNSTTVMAMLHDFRPSLPWPLYLVTQALAHKIVMAAFRRFLRKQKDAS